MSTNIFISASVNCTIHLKQKDIPSRKVETFDCLLTPTDITMKIVSLDSIEKRIEAYKEWSKKNCPQGYLNERTYGEAHAKTLDEWINNHEGWEIDVFAM